MFDQNIEQPHTQHTTLPVPLVYFGDRDITLNANSLARWNSSSATASSGIGTSSVAPRPQQLPKTMLRVAILVVGATALLPRPQPQIRSTPLRGAALEWSPAGVAQADGTLVSKTFAYAPTLACAADAGVTSIETSVCVVGEKWLGRRLMSSSTR